jgi:hypothetical protein
MRFSIHDYYPKVTQRPGFRFADADHEFRAVDRPRGIYSRVNSRVTGNRRRTRRALLGEHTALSTPNRYTRLRTLPAWTCPLQPLADNLNPEQRAAVEASEGPLLILAGAGSGKTRVITSRIAWLIQEKGVAPDSILAVTFTNKAASEMGERVDRLLGHSSLAKPLLCTFHSFCVRILRRDIEALKVGGEGLTRSFAIYDENDQQGIVKQIMKRMGLDTKQLTPRTVLGRISWAKSHMIDPQEYYLSSKDPNGERIAHIFQSYQAELRKCNALDFDDLLLEAVRLLKVSSEARERYQRRYRLSAGGRVPGHQPPPVRADEAAGRGAKERLRGGRRGPEHLFVARRRHPQHSGV